jgi:hypothetical protein
MVAVSTSRNAPQPQNVRGTLLISSRTQIVALGYGDEYDRALDPLAKSELASVIGASWVSMKLAHHHYSAVDSLRIPEALLDECHRKVADRLHGIFLGTALRGLKAAGLLSPARALDLVPKIVSRIFDGGITSVEHVGTNESKVLFKGNPLVSHDYFRAALRNHILTGMELCSTRPSVREEGRDPVRDAIQFRVSWLRG